MPTCQGCTDSTSPISLTGTWFPGSPCITSSDCGGSNVNAACVIYNGLALPCSGIENLDDLETIIEKLDQAVCAITGDFTSYNMNCLPDWWGEPITSEEDFVDAITLYACELSDTVTTFIDTTYVEDIAEIMTLIEGMTDPSITCASADVTEEDTLTEILEKYCSKFASLDEELDVSTVTFDECFTVVGDVTTVTQALQTLADQICALYESINEGGILPTFSNYGTCIGGTSEDTLVETIDLIITRLCQAPIVDLDEIVWGCFGTQPEDFQEFIQSTVDYLNSLNGYKYTFNPDDFDLEAVDPMDECAGQMVSLATPADIDRFVAVNADDDDPGTLIDKLVSAGSISFDDSTDTELSLDITDGDYTDITVSDDGLTWEVNESAITFAKFQDVNTGVILGRSTASTGVVEEITIGTGLELAGGVLSSLLEGRTLIGITQFTSSGTWTKPDGCTSAVVLVAGAGGGGGGAEGTAAESAAAGGGGGGAHAMCFLDGILGTTEIVTIGAGGAGGSAGNNNGSAGGNTSFGGLMIMGGGSGGTGMASGTSIAAVEGGSGGIVLGVIGTLMYYSVGDFGGPGVRMAAQVSMSGAGGASAFGAGNGPRVSHASVPAVNALGAGGNGAICVNNNTDVAGGNGAPGKIIVYEYS